MELPSGIDRVANLDGDVMVYRAGFAAQHTVYEVHSTDPNYEGIPLAEFPYRDECTLWIDGDPELKVVTRIDVEPEQNAKHNYAAMVKKCLDQIGGEVFNLFLTGKGNYREKLATLKPYKGNRDPNAKPVHYDFLRKYAQTKWGAQVIDHMEADDAMGIKGWASYVEWKKSGLPIGHTRAVLCTIDKDLNMIPGLHYNFVKDEITWIDEEEALRFFYWQVLTGDPTDNIGGCPKIGPKKATALLEGLTTEDELYETVLGAYANAYKDLPAAEVERIVFENGSLLWILREEGKFWLPPDRR